MKSARRASFWCAALIIAAALPRMLRATGVPIGGFSPLVGIALTNEFDDDLNIFSVPSSAPAGTLLGPGGAHYDVALLDTGAAVSVLTSDAVLDFNFGGSYPFAPEGFFGSEVIPIGGAAGTLLADINDPVGLYAGGLQGRSGVSPFVMNHSALEGQTNTSLITAPAESDLPNVVGLPFASQYATYIRNDMPQLFSLGDKTVRSPFIDFLPLGSGGSQGIVRRAPLNLNPSESFQLPPAWLYNIENFDIDNPHENPSQPTVMQGGLFLTASVAENGNQLSNRQFFFDTGADVTVVSEFNAVLLGFDPVEDEPDFTVAVVGSAGIREDVPGFFADSFTLPAVGGTITLNNVPIIVLNVPDPSGAANFVEGILGTNLFSGRNLVIDPEPAIGAASGAFATSGNWSGSTTPSLLSIANVRHVSGGNQTAVVGASTEVWELNVSSSAAQTMTVQIPSGITLTTFSGVNIEAGGAIELANGTLDAHYVELLGGTLRGSGEIRVGSGPIPSQIENRIGTIAPGNGVGTLEIDGRFSNGQDGTIAMELGGTAPGSGYDQLVITGPATIDGTLAVSLVNLGGGLFAPDVGDQFTLLTASDGVRGEFSQLMLPLAFNWRVEYEVDLVNLIVGLPGDYNDDGTVNAADYTVWRNTLGTSAQDADGNGSGMVDAGDFLVWKSNFGMSEGAGASLGQPGNVPEPASAFLVLVASSSVFAARRTRHARR
jgi:hypothetical protein